MKYTSSTESNQVNQRVAKMAGGSAITAPINAGFHLTSFITIRVGEEKRMNHLEYTQPSCV